MIGASNPRCAGYVNANNEVVFVVNPADRAIILFASMFGYQLNKGNE